MGYTEGPTRTFTSGEALAANRLVKLSSGTVVYADATDYPIGVTERAALTSGDPVAVRLANAAGTVELTASAAVTAGATLYGTNDGKVDDADPGSGKKVGMALEAATANNDIIECMLVQTPL